MKKKKILVIDDEAQIRRLLKVALEPHDYLVRDVDTGEAGLQEAATSPPELIILDLGLPGISGHDVLKRLREWFERPILILSVRDDEENIISALDGGADDYITKPFGVGELLARMRACLRKTSIPSEPLIKIGTLSIDLANRQVHLNNSEVKLTSTEYSVLSALSKNAGKVVTHGQLLKQIWGPKSENQVQYLRVYVGHLRQKIEVDPGQPKIIITEAGIGYRLNVSNLNDEEAR